MGRKGGSSRSDAKRTASRANGRKGGRPMGWRRAVRILAGIADGDVDEARAVVYRAVCAESRVGDPHQSLMDWIAAPNGLKGDETIDTIVAEWDAAE